MRPTDLFKVPTLAAAAAAFLLCATPAPALTRRHRAAAAPRHPNALVFRGTVVHINQKAHSFTLSTKRGVLRPIHAAKLPPLGSRVVVRVKQLRNGTFGAKRLRVLGRGRHRQVKVHGVVTYVNRSLGTFVVSGQGVSLAVREQPGRVRIASALPAVGTKLTVAGDLEQSGEIEAQVIKPEGSDEGPFDLEGTVLALDPTARTLTVSAEDSDRLAGTVTVTVPGALTFPTYTVGEEVELQVVLANGALTLSGASSDGSEKAAEDSSLQEGEQTDAADKEDAQDEAAGDGQGHDEKEQGADEGSQPAKEGSSGTPTEG